MKNSVAGRNAPAKRYHRDAWGEGGGSFDASRRMVDVASGSGRKVRRTLRFAVRNRYPCAAGGLIALRGWCLSYARPTRGRVAGAWLWDRATPNVQVLRSTEKASPAHRSRRGAGCSCSRGAGRGAGRPPRATAANSVVFHGELARFSASIVSADPQLWAKTKVSEFCFRSLLAGAPGARARPLPGAVRCTCRPAALAAAAGHRKARPARARRARVAAARRYGVTYQASRMQLSTATQASPSSKRSRIGHLLALQVGHD